MTILLQRGGELLARSLAFRPLSCCEEPNSRPDGACCLCISASLYCAMNGASGHEVLLLSSLPPPFAVVVVGFFPFRHRRYVANEYKYLNWYVQEKAAILMNFNHLTCNFIRISFGSCPNLIRVLLEFLLNFYSNLIRALLEILLSFYSNLIRISTFMWNLSHRNRTPFTHLYEIFRKFMWNLLQVCMKSFAS